MPNIVSDLHIVWWCTPILNSSSRFVYAWEFFGLFTFPLSPAAMVSPFIPLLSDEILGPAVSWGILWNFKRLKDDLPTLSIAPRNSGKAWENNLRLRNTIQFNMAQTNYFFRISILYYFYLIFRILMITCCLCILSGRIYFIFCIILSIIISYTKIFRFLSKTN